MKFRVSDSINPSGTHLIGYVNVPFSKVAEIFGEPCGGDGEKVAFEWVIEFEDGTIATIYDYKASSVYDSDLPSPESLRLNEFSAWHVGGFDDRALHRVQEALGIVP